MKISEARQKRGADINIGTREEKRKKNSSLEGLVQNVKKEVTDNQGANEVTVVTAHGTKKKSQPRPPSASSQPQPPPPPKRTTKSGDDLATGQNDSLRSKGNVPPPPPPRSDPPQTKRILTTKEQIAGKAQEAQKGNAQNPSARIQQPPRKPAPPFSSQSGMTKPAPPSRQSSKDASSSNVHTQPQQTQSTINKASSNLDLAKQLQSPDNKPTVNLPPGWMCVWSKSQKRWYFFDTKTNKSVWEWPLPGGVK